MIYIKYAGIALILLSSFSISGILCGRLRFSGKLIDDILELAREIKNKIEFYNTETDKIIIQSKDTNYAAECVYRYGFEGLAEDIRHSEICSREKLCALVNDLSQSAENCTRSQALEGCEYFISRPER